MYIKSLEYYNADSEWQLLSLELNQPLTLLVGASGVGKTQILHSLLTLQQIANGKASSGIQWKIEFDTDQEHTYVWEGKFESQVIPQHMQGKIILKEDELPKIISEKLTLNGNEILTRDENGIIFENKPTVQLPRYQSILKLLVEEKVLCATKEFLKIHPTNNYDNSFLTPKTLLEKYSSLKNIVESTENVLTKLWFTYVKAKDTFEHIKGDFLSVFPHVEDVKIELQPFPFSIALQNIPVSSDEMPSIVTIQIKEKGVKHWIWKDKMSSGMLRTLIHIAEIYLCADGSVILIDEFENSLGVNCIDTVTDYLMNHERDLQFIITTHHPYIINHIPSKYWKLVTRQGGKVMTRDASEFNLGNSKHEAFIQLMNLDEYNEGVAV